MNNRLRNATLACLVTGTTLCSSSLLAQTDWEGRAHDAWIDGKLESSYLLNTELNNFRIDTMVENGVVTLGGEVPSAVHRGLAGQIAANLDGVTKVNNNLTLGESTEMYSEQERNFSTRFYDLTTTAGLKTKYALNSELKALDIDIGTMDGVVTLEGEVASSTAKQLAGEIAEGFEHVSKVENRLVVVQR